MLFTIWKPAQQRLSSQLCSSPPMASLSSESKTRHWELSKVTIMALIILQYDHNGPNHSPRWSSWSWSFWDVTIIIIIKIPPVWSRTVLQRNCRYHDHFLNADRHRSFYRIIIITVSPVLSRTPWAWGCPVLGTPRWSLNQIGRQTCHWTAVPASKQGWRQSHIKRELRMSQFWEEID